MDGAMICPGTKRDDSTWMDGGQAGTNIEHLLFPQTGTGNEARKFLGSIACPCHTREKTREELVALLPRVQKTTEPLLRGY